MLVSSPPAAPPAAPTVAWAGRASGAVELGLLFMSDPDNGGFMTIY